MSDPEHRSSTPESLEVTLTEAGWYESLHPLCSCQVQKGTQIFGTHPYIAVVLNQGMEQTAVCT